MFDWILNVVIGFVIGFYLLCLLCCWFDGEFMFVFGMDMGMCVLLIMLFINVGYVLFVLMMFGLFGVRWNNFVWIVSVLLVGIGFGL